MSNDKENKPTVTASTVAPTAVKPTAPVVAESKPQEGTEEKVQRIFDTAAEAQKRADANNAKPLNEGQEKRVSYKVYEIKWADKKVYAVAQTPAYALNFANEFLGITIEVVSTDNLLPPEEYLKRLSPEALEAARKFLGAK